MMVQDCQALYRCVHAGAGAGLQVRDPGGEHQRDGRGGPDQGVRLEGGEDAANPHSLHQHASTRDGLIC